MHFLFHNSFHEGEDPKTATSWHRWEIGFPPHSFRSVTGSWAKTETSKTLQVGGTARKRLFPSTDPTRGGICRKNTGHHHLSSRWRQGPCPGQGEGWNVPPESPECLFEALIRTMMDNSRGAIKVISGWCYPATKEGGRSSSQRHRSSDAGSTMREVWRPFHCYS